MDTGTKISGGLHVAVIGLALFGGVFSSDPEPVDLRDVSIVTAEQFAALTQAPQAAGAPEAPDAPEAQSDTPDLPQTDTAPATERPDAATEPQADTRPEQRPDPLPPEPEAAEDSPQISPPDAEVALLPPVPSVRPRPRAAERVAPQPVAPPPEEASPDPETTPDTAPVPDAPSEQEPEEASAPEEATDRIAPETDDSGPLAPTASLRPPARPSRPAPQQAETAEAPRRDSEDAVQAALREALGDPAAASGTPAPVPSGPPLTSGEKSALVVAVSSCWNIGSLSSAAMATTVVVAVQMSEDAKPIVPTIRLVSSSGGPDSAAQQAFGAARRAIIRCGARGFDLPRDKFSQWRDIEMTFNPERMQIR